MSETTHIVGRWCDDLHCMKCYSADAWQKSRIAELERELAALRAPETCPLCDECPCKKGSR